MLLLLSDLSSAGRITVLSPVSVSEADTYWNSVQTIREDLDVLLEQSHSFPSLKAHFQVLSSTMREHTGMQSPCTLWLASDSLGLPSASFKVLSPPVVPFSSL